MGLKGEAAATWGTLFSTACPPLLHLHTAAVRSTVQEPVSSCVVSFLSEDGEQVEKVTHKKTLPFPDLLQDSKTRVASTSVLPGHPQGLLHLYPPHLREKLPVGAFEYRVGGGFAWGYW